MIKSRFKQLFCKHKFKFHSQDIRRMHTCSDSYYRRVDIYECIKCGKIKKRTINYK